MASLVHLSHDALSGGVHRNRFGPSATLRMSRNFSGSAFAISVECCGNLLPAHRSIATTFASYSAEPPVASLIFPMSPAPSSAAAGKCPASILPTPARLSANTCLKRKLRHTAKSTSKPTANFSALFLSKSPSFRTHLLSCLRPNKFRCSWQSRTRAHRIFFTAWNPSLTS